MRDKNQSFHSNFDGLLYSVLYTILPPFLYACANRTNNRGNVFPITAIFGFCDSFLICKSFESEATSPQEPSILMDFCFFCLYLLIIYLASLGVSCSTQDF